MADLKLEDDSYCFVCGTHNSSGLKLSFNYSGQKAYAEFSVTKAHQGYKDIVHGGIIATIIDEALIKAALANGLNAMTAEVTVRFKNPLYINEPASIEAEITKHKDKLIEARAYITGPDSRKVAEGHGKLFVSQLG